MHCYYLGQERGSALANVLSGAVTPSGKLPFSMEQSFSDSPAYGYNVLDDEDFDPEFLFSSGAPPLLTAKLEPVIGSYVVLDRWADYLSSSSLV